MSRPIVEVQNLSKRYRLGAVGATSLREEVSRLWDRVRGVPHPDAQEFWALRDVSFEIQPGEVVGVIGRNGAGKSTLLKILSRITEPTSGSAVMRGRVASLLEVGTGFHPELSGRENVFLNGAILGMSRAEVRQKFDEIVAFAEIDKFIDTPVKRYSSGMYVRLAFAVAAHLEPEILIIDEVLAVGDGQFQKKCLDKMGSVAREGRTVLFVSHNLQAVTTLCTHALLLENGQCTLRGTAAEVAHRYLAKNQDVERTKWTGDEGDDSGRMLETWIHSGDDHGVYHTGAELEIGIRIRLLKPIEGLILGFRIFSEQGATLIYSLHDDVLEGRPRSYAPGEIEKKFYIPKDFLGEGRYQIGFCFGVHNQRAIVLNNHGNLVVRLINVSGIGRLHLGVSGVGFESIVRPQLKVI